MLSLSGAELRYSQGRPPRWDERNTGTTCPRRWSVRRDGTGVPYESRAAKGGGSANKTFLQQEPRHCAPAEAAASSTRRCAAGTAAGPPDTSVASAGVAEHTLRWPSWRPPAPGHAAPQVRARARVPGPGPGAAGAGLTAVRQRAQFGASTSTRRPGDPAPRHGASCPSASQCHARPNGRRARRSRRRGVTEAPSATPRVLHDAPPDHLSTSGCGRPGRPMARSSAALDPAGREAGPTERAACRGPRHSHGADRRAVGGGEDMRTTCATTPSTTRGRRRSPAGLVYGSCGPTRRADGL